MTDDFFTLGCLLALLALGLVAVWIYDPQRDKSVWDALWRLIR